MNNSIRRIDDLGRIVIPKAMRLSWGIKEGEAFEISVEGEKIILKRWSPAETNEKDGW